MVAGWYHVMYCVHTNNNLLAFNTYRENDMKYLTVHVVEDPATNNPTITGGVIYDNDRIKPSFSLWVESKTDVRMIFKTIGEEQDKFIYARINLFVDPADPTKMTMV